MACSFTYQPLSGSCALSVLLVEIYVYSLVFRRGSVGNSTGRGDFTNLKVLPCNWQMVWVDFKESAAHQPFGPTLKQSKYPSLDSSSSWNMVASRGVSILLQSGSTHVATKEKAESKLRTCQIWYLSTRHNYQRPSYDQLCVILLHSQNVEIVEFSKWCSSIWSPFSTGSFL